MDKRQISEVVEENQAAFFADLKTVIAIPSVKGTFGPGTPFGKEPKKALLTALSLAESYGFETKIVNDAVGYAQFGEGEEYIGIIGHLDVVPEGVGWTSPPYELTLRNDRLYARGILDNKGPIMSCLYGLKLLKEAGFVPKIPIRILFGTDEESGSADIPLYLQKERPPLFGFTPDCKYPVVYGERGVVGYRITSRFSEEDLAVIGPIKGEQGRAFVPEQLSVTAAGERFRVSGKKAPSNAPELGENAITLLAEALKEQAALPSTLHTYFAWISEHLHQQHKGEGLGIAYQDADSGALMLTPVLLEKVAAGFVLDLSIRYPISAAEEQITEQLQKALPANSTLTVTRRMKSSCFSKEHLGVRLLTDVYEDVMQTAGQPVTTTGATYARFMPNIVAFGPSFPGQKGIAHNRDEWMAAADLLLNMKIYMNAMIQLSQRNLAEYEEEGK